MTTDLSQEHGPVSSLFGTAKREERSKLELSSSQLADFQRDGFVAPVRLFDDAQIAVLRDELADLMQPEHEGRELWYEHHSNESSETGATLFHALGAWRLRPGLHDVLWNPAFTTAAKQLLGGPVRFWHDQLFCKPAKHGGVVAWHQDYSYWTQTVPMQHLTCWVGLDDSTTENGCVHYVPGSHNWPLLPRTDLANNMEAILEVLSPEQLATFKPVPCELKAGEASFHHPLTLHGSHANQSELPRRAIVINVFLDGTRSDKDEAILDGTLPIPAGKPMGGQFHPLLSE